MIDFWPDYKQIVQRTPLKVLMEQASLLGKKTNNYVVAEVFRAETPFGYADEFKYDFYVIAPRLDNYRYRLFSIAYDLDLYPAVFCLGESLQKELKLKLGEWEGNLTASSEEEFQSILREIFHSERARLAIGLLLAQSEANDAL
jgi:hypothetical protein